MNLKQLGTSIASFAPTLAAMLGGPLAGTAVSALESALGLTAGAGPEAVTQVLQNGTMTPEQLGAIRAADQKHAEIMGQQGIDLAKINADHDTAFAKIDADDRASARGMNIQTHDTTPKYLAYFVTGGFFLTLGYLIVYGKPTAGGDVMLVMVGSLGTAWASIVSFFYGSSAGSAAKTDVINKIAATK